MSLRSLLGGAFSSLIGRNRYRINLSVQLADSLLRGMEDVERAQDQFARAMLRYAEQLKSHTSAIEGISRASHELTKSAAEQNKFLLRLTSLLELPPAKVEQVIPEPGEEIEVKKHMYPPGCYRRRLSQDKDEQLVYR